MNKLTKVISLITMMVCIQGVQPTINTLINEVDTMMSDRATLPGMTFLFDYILAETDDNLPFAYQLENLIEQKQPCIVHANIFFTLFYEY